MFRALTPSPMAQWLTAIPVWRPRRLGQGLADVLHVHVIDTVLELLAERDGVLAGDEAVAGIEVERQKRRIDKGQHLRQRLGPGREVAVDLDVDRDLVGIRHLDDLAVAPLHQLQRLLVGKPRGPVQAVGRGDPFASGVLGPGDRPEHVGNAVKGAVLAGERIGCIDLGEPDPERSIFRRKSSGSSWSATCG